MKVTLITGASSGIGEAFARRLAAEKHDMVLVARNEKKLHELCDELMLKHQIMAHYVVLDLTDDEAVGRLFEETQRHGFEVDWLINNAGFGSMGDFVDLDIQKELNMIELNISSLVALTHIYLSGMRSRKRGTIINISSGASFQPIPFMATYAATKAFVSSFSEAVAEENRPFGITVTALCPGATMTNFFAASDISDPIKVKGQQTAEEVVETGLKAALQGRRKKVSGFANYIVALFGTHSPTWLTSLVIARALRPKFQGKE